MSTWVPGSDANFGTSPLLATPVVPGTPHRFAFHRHFAIALFFTDPCVHVTGSPKPRAGTRFKVCPGHIDHAHSSGHVRKKIGPLLRVQKNYAKKSPSQAAKQGFEPSTFAQTLPHANRCTTRITPHKFEPLLAIFAS